MYRKYETCLHSIDSHKKLNRDVRSFKLFWPLLSFLCFSPCTDAYEIWYFRVKICCTIVKQTLRDSSSDIAIRCKTIKENVFCFIIVHISVL